MADARVDPKSAPPLHTWLLSAALVLALLLLILALLPAGWHAQDIRLPGRQYQLELCRQHLQSEKASAPGDRPLVILLGTSLLQSAGGQLQAFNSRTDLTARIDGCWIHWGQWQDFAQLQGLIRARKPALLLLHEDALSTTSAEQIPLSARFIKAVSIRTRSALNIPLSPMLNPYTSPLTCGNRPPVAAELRAQSYSDHAPTFRQAERWIRSLASAGIKVAIVKVPRLAALQQQIDALRPEWNRDIRTLAANSGSDYLELPSSDSAAFYCGDQAHISGTGREATAAQLATLINNTINR